MAAPVASNATHAEQQLLEVAAGVFALEGTELAKDTPAITARRVAITPNFVTSTVQITVTLPITIGTDADGGMSFDVNEVLPSA
ncbi:MAG: hypothetical protein AAF773_07710 [Cyanobacteria bacterium P01_D01_bin.115]